MKNSRSKYSPLTKHFFLPLSKKEMDSEDIRRHQRLKNYQKALAQLNKAVAIGKERRLNDLERQGLIQAFEFTHELAWNVMKDYFFYQGNSEIGGSRDASREALKSGLIANGEIWMEMIASRNKTSHTYEEAVAQEITSHIISAYLEQLNALEIKMLKIQEAGKKT